MEGQDNLTFTVKADASGVAEAIIAQMRAAEQAVARSSALTPRPSTAAVAAAGPAQPLVPQPLIPQPTRPAAVASPGVLNPQQPSYPSRLPQPAMAAAAAPAPPLAVTPTAPPPPIIATPTTAAAGGGAGGAGGVAGGAMAAGMGSLLSVLGGMAIVSTLTKLVGGQFAAAREWQMMPLRERSLQFAGQRAAFGADTINQQIAYEITSAGAKKHDFDSTIGQIPIIGGLIDNITGSSHSLELAKAAAERLSDIHQKTATILNDSMARGFAATGDPMGALMIRQRQEKREAELNDWKATQEFRDAEKERDAFRGGKPLAIRLMGPAGDAMFENARKEAEEQYKARRQALVEAQEARREQGKTVAQERQVATEQWKATREGAAGQAAGHQLQARASDAVLAGDVKGEFVAQRAQEALAMEMRHRQQLAGARGPMRDLMLEQQRQEKAAFEKDTAMRWRQTATSLPMAETAQQVDVRGMASWNAIAWRQGMDGDVQTRIADTLDRILRQLEKNPLVQ